MKINTQIILVLLFSMITISWLFGGIPIYILKTCYNYCESDIITTNITILIVTLWIISWIKFFED